eukprot:5254999-Heterocapsa_arctica.AAC.1
MLSPEGIFHIDGTSEGAGRRRSEHEHRELTYFSMWIKHLFNGTVYAFQPLLVVQGPYIWWSRR